MRRRATYVLMAAALVAIAVAVSGCSSAQSSTPPQTTAPATTVPQDSQSQPAAPPQTTPDVFPGKTGPATKLKIKDVKVGTGPAAKSGDNVTVDYTGWLTDGTKFDSSKDHGQPFSFPLGAGQVIPGWDQGVAGMKVGGVRVLIIPPAMGYGAAGSPPAIPPNATLVFTVTLLKIN